MSKMIVSVFDDEQTAYKGTQALTELHREGSISVYSAAVVSRDADGAIRIKDAGDEGPLGTALGMLTGAIIGVLGGPTGVVVGTAAGGMFDRGDQRKGSGLFVRGHRLDDHVRRGAPAPHHDEACRHGKRDRFHLRFPK